MKPLLLSLAVVLCGITACTNSYEGADETEAAGAAASTSAPPLSPAAAAGLPDYARKLVRTADLTFKTRSVLQATQAIEQLVLRQKGYVAESRLQTTVNETHTVTVSADSALQTTLYTVENQMTIKVPRQSLDTVLQAIAGLALQVDSRVATAEDVNLQLLRNRLTQQRNTQTATRLSSSSEKPSSKPLVRIATEELALQRREAADEAALQNLELTDRLLLSQITLRFYQPQQARHELVENRARYEQLKPYEPGLHLKIAASFAEGWKVLETLLLALIRLWGVLLLGLLGWLGYKRYVRKQLQPGS